MTNIPKVLLLAVMLAFALPTRATVGCIGDDSEECRWDSLDYTLQGGFLTITSIDWFITHNAIGKNSPEWYESNIVLGRHPSQEKLAVYNLSAMAGHTAIAMILPRPWRTIWQSVWIGVGIDAVSVWGCNLHLAF